MKKFKKLTALTLTLVTILGSAMTVNAAPKTMPDGQTFDAEFYAKNNPDVVAVLSTDEAALYNHYVTYGKTEGRKPYADVQAMQTKTDSWTIPATALIDYRADHSWLVDAKDDDGRYWYSPIMLEGNEGSIAECLAGAQELYPTGRVFDANHWYHWLGHTKGDGLNRNYAACGGFALLLQDMIYGTTPATVMTGKGTPISLYDIIMLDPAANGGAGHYAFVTGINPENQTVTVAEANVHVQNPDGSVSAGMIYWNRTYNAKEIMGVIHRG